MQEKLWCDRFEFEQLHSLQQGEQAPFESESTSRNGSLSLEMHNAYFCEDQIRTHASNAVDERKQNWKVPTDIMKQDAIEEVTDCVQDEP